MRGVVFDLDETLIDRHLAVTNFAKCLWNDHFSKIEAAPDTFLAKVHHLDGHGYVSRDHFFESMIKNFSGTIDSMEIVEKAFYGQVWETPLLAEGVIECLEFLRRKDVPLAIVTNGSKVAQEAKITKSGVARYFDVIIISEEFGVKKPDPSIYKAAASGIHASPEDCWFVGDHPVNDIWGSKKVGYSAAWVHLNRPWATEIDYCYDKKGANFKETMDQVLEGI